MEEKTLFDELKELPFEEASKTINEAIKKATIGGKNPAGSRTFKKDSELGVVFSVVESYFKNHGYEFNGIEFALPKKETQRVENLEYDMFDFRKRNRNDHKKMTTEINKQAEEALEKLVIEYPDFSKKDLINYAIYEFAQKHLGGLSNAARTL